MSGGGAWRVVGSAATGRGRSEARPPELGGGACARRSVAGHKLVRRAGGAGEAAAAAAGEAGPGPGPARSQGCLQGGTWGLRERRWGGRQP